MRLPSILQALQKKVTKVDQALLQDLKLGEQRAVDIWYQKYWPVVERSIAQKVESAHDVEELTQQTFLHCLKHLPLFRGESSIKTWMLRIAHHEVADYYRKKYAKKALQALPLHEILLAEPVSDAHETAVLVKQVLGQLSTQYRELLLLKYVDNKTVKEIAYLVGKSVKSVESDLFRARREFQELYSSALYAQ